MFFWFSFSDNVSFFFFFFFNDTATTEIYTLSLHDALPFRRRAPRHPPGTQPPAGRSTPALAAREAVADQPENQARRGDPLRAVALGWPLPLSRRRPDRNRQQRGGASHPAAGPQSQERTIRRLGRRGRALGS